MKGHILHDSMYTRYPGELQSQKQKVRWWLLGPGGGRNRESVLNGDRVSVWDNERVLKTNGGDGWCNNVNILSATELYT